MTSSGQGAVPEPVDREVGNHPPADGRIRFERPTDQGIWGWGGPNSLVRAGRGVGLWVNRDADEVDDAVVGEQAVGDNGAGEDARDDEHPGGRKAGLDLG